LQALSRQGRHAGLAPRLAAVLRQLRSDGLLDRYAEQARLESAPRRR
jgi:hypothetical protein